MDAAGVMGAAGAAQAAEVQFDRVGFTLANGSAILDRLSLTLAAGSTTALLGRSGSGKTTLMRMVNGLILPTSGSVRVAGRPTTQWNPLELRRGIGYVIQETGLFPHWTVARNSGLALELAGRPLPECQQRAQEMLTLAGLDPALGSRYPWQLSGGQRQRVGLARALAADPAILLMDEPFGALDPMSRAEMQTMLRELLGRVRKTVLLVTHDLEEALYLADRVIFLERGCIAADLPAEAVLTSQEEYVRGYVHATHRGSQARGNA